MAPLDDLSGDRILAEFEAMIRDTGGFGPDRRDRDGFKGLVPERRAVNWVNALAALAREIEERQGPHRAEMLLRTVGSRMSRELLSPLPAARDEFEPAINRALSILDWGWVAVLDRQDTIVFEHRPPWPFENRIEHLPFVLEGFYGDTLHRLSDNLAMHVRLTGKRGGALVFKWLPVDVAESAAAAPAMPGVIIAAPAAVSEAAPMAAAPEAVAAAPAAADRQEEEALTVEEVVLAEELEDAVVADPKIAPVVEPPVPPATAASPIRPFPREAWEPVRPVIPPRARMRRAGGSGRALLVAATVFIGLFALGTMSSGDMIAGAAQRVGSLFGHAAHGAAADLENRAKAGDTDAQIRLGLNSIGAGANPDYAAAAHWFEAAARTGSLEAQYDLGVLTAEGLGVKRDPVGAAILFMNAAAGGFPQAEYRIGTAYQNGFGVPRSAPFAAMWLERAARHGVRQAQMALAALYVAGAGVPADPIMAFAWYRLAEEEGDRMATPKRVELYRAMTTEQRQAAMRQAKTLIGDVMGAAGLAPSPAHPTVDRLIARLS